MTAQHSKSVLYMAMELSSKTWRLRFGDGKKVRDRSVAARDLAGLMSEIAASKERLGLAADTPVVSCYEAGRDGFWIHRFLTKHGVENLVVDPASIEVDRRKRRAKTDRLDAERLLLMLLRYRLYGERTTWKICRVPSEEAEDERRVGRELDRLTKERTGHLCRIRSLLVVCGVEAEPLADLSLVTDWEGKPLLREQLAELEREQVRLRLVNQQIRQVQALKRQRLGCPVSEADRKASKLMKLRAVGPVTSWTLSKEFFGWRDFQNRRQVGSAAGLTGTPYDSGESRREQGISKAGSKWVRKTCIELAWNWLRYQPQSALSLWYVQKFGSGGRRLRRIGIVALARKVLVALWKYLEHDDLPEGAWLKQPFIRALR
jgi:transposase